MSADNPYEKGPNYDPIGENSVIDFDKTFGRIVNLPDGSVRIPDPLTREDRLQLQEELKDVERAQHLGYVATGIIEVRR